jgi:hypothetical protein
MTRKSFLALCGSVLAAPFVTKKAQRNVEILAVRTIPNPPDPPRFKNIVLDRDCPKNMMYIMNTEQTVLYQRILNSEGERLYGIGSWDTNRGDSN